jgi:uracil-DNA glycosylase
LIELIEGNGSLQARQDDSGRQFEQLKESWLACSGCALRSSCSRVVFGEGNRQARLMLIGEAPGADEDRTGIPFVGRAGQLLDRILEAAEIKRDQIYITNVVKCRPPANRLPLPAEVDACLPCLKKQIELTDPKIILCLGALATRTLIDKNAAITRIRGKWHQIKGRHVMATFHPAFLLRNPGKKKDVWEDIRQVKKLYQEINEGGHS